MAKGRAKSLAQGFAPLKPDFAHAQETLEPGTKVDLKVGDAWDEAGSSSLATAPANMTSGSSQTSVT